ncbi:transcription elongation factor GreA [SAR202 cluster bacterium AC-647-N09_OGT_505m]|nr:transcription elongation factor GreA [SAR202 cluster bacterium AC-647-N09_OGT_505m]
MQSYPIALSQALTQYLSTRQFHGGVDTQQELTKFIMWFGRDRAVDNLTPQDTASYGDRLAESSGLQDTTERVQAIKDFLSYCYKSNFTQTPLAKHVRVRKKVRKSTTHKDKQRVAMDITPEGYQNLLSELEILRDSRIAVARDISLAAEDKDFRENAPLDAARERQGLLEARIRYLEDGLQRAHLTYADSQNSDAQMKQRVKLGSKVRLSDSSSKEEMEYTLVNASEASPMDFKMSVSSPVGKALMDHTMGEEVEVATPRGNLRYLIKEVD